MRIATYQQANWTKQELGKAQTKVSYHQQQISSGKKYMRMSEEPMAASRVLAVKHTIRGVEQAQQNISDAQGILNTTEVSLKGIQKVLDRVNVLTTQSLNGTNSQENLDAAATEIDNLIKQAIYLGNTEHDGNHIFGGNEYAKQPFTEDGTFQGGSEDISWKVSHSYSISVFQSGDKTITPVISTLKKIRDQLRAGDTEGLRISLTENQQNSENVISSISGVGATLSTLQSLTDILNEQKLGLEEHRSSVEDVDIVDAVSDLSHMNTTYQAMLQATAMMNKVSILNYM